MRNTNLVSKKVFRPVFVAWCKMGLWFVAKNLPELTSTDQNNGVQVTCGYS